MDGSTEGTEPDSHSISLQPLTPQHTGGDGSTIVSPTNTHYDGASDIERSKGDDAHAAKTGGEIDAGPFLFKPYRLASLVNPKNTDELKEMGGVTSLLKGLGTHRKLWEHDRQLETAAGDVPKLVLTGSGGDDDCGVIGGSAVDEPKNGTGPTVNDAGLDERRRVHGANVIPTRQSKSLLQLMWLALKNKVLVLLSIAAVISLALSFFEDLGAPHEPGEPPVDLVEVVAIGGADRERDAHYGSTPSYARTEDCAQTHKHRKIILESSSGRWMAPLSPLARRQLLTVKTISLSLSDFISRSAHSPLWPTSRTSSLSEHRP
ncbi:hypothetical protein C8Q76DRAFT_803961 [Earliella scabrosa]|nr:hypothetical protein C8Q76DRAFT_803961 [Earliella scabrosa]